MAAIRTPEPNKTKVIKGIEFSIADQKALTFSHLIVNKDVFVYHTKVAADTDGTYQDIRPEAFHQIILTAVGKEERLSLLMTLRSAGME